MNNDLDKQEAGLNQSINLSKYKPCKTKAAIIFLANSILCLTMLDELCLDRVPFLFTAAYALISSTVLIYYINKKT